MKSKYPERNHPKEYKDYPCCLRQVFIIRIWQDFYKEDLSPWVLSSIHIQRIIPTIPGQVIRDRYSVPPAHLKPAVLGREKEKADIVSDYLTNGH